MDFKFLKDILPGGVIFIRGREKYQGRPPKISITWLPLFSLSLGFFFKTMFSSLYRALLFIYLSSSSTSKEVFEQVSSSGTMVILVLLYLL